MKILKSWIAHAFYDWLLSVKEPAVEYMCRISELGRSVLKILKKIFRCHDMIMHTTIKIVQEKVFLAALPGNKGWTLKKQDLKKKHWPFWSLMLNIQDKKTLTLLIFDIEHTMTTQENKQMGHGGNLSSVVTQGRHDQTQIILFRTHYTRPCSLEKSLMLWKAKGKRRRECLVLK